jgi:deoxyribonucleoside regulator
MSDNCDYAQLYRIAKRYYIDNFSQAKIAVEESISRPHVSRLLAKARELGIVRISVQMPFSYESLAIANKLKERLGLSRVELACFPGQDGYSEERLSLAIATHASAILPELLSESENIGVGWGHTVYQTSMLLERQSSNPEKTFIPLLGVSGEDNPHPQY